MPRARRARSLALLAVLGIAVLAGCDDEGGSDGTSQSEAPSGGEGSGDGDSAAESAGPVPPPTEPADIEVAGGERSASQDGATIAIEASAAAFVTPTGNIACVLTSGSATCQVAETAYTPNADHLLATNLGSCAAEDADAMVLSAEQGAWTCPPEPLAPTAALDAGGWWEPEVEGDTVEVEGVRSAVLPYGETIRLGATSCTSAENGVTCQNTDLGEQFFVSRDYYEFNRVR